MTTPLPTIQAIVQLRSQYINERLGEQIGSGCKQIVILGSGFEPDPVLFATSDIRYFQISQAAQTDQAVIIHAETAPLPVHSIAANTIHITGGYLQPNLITRLQQHQFDVHLPTYIAWVNVSALKRGDIIALIDTLRNQIRQFHLSFDYLSHQVSDRSLNHPKVNQILDRLEYQGIRWITSFKEIATFTRGLGLELRETMSIAQLHERYCPQVSLPSPLLNFYCVCTITKQGLSW